MQCTEYYAHMDAQLKLFILFLAGALFLYGAFMLGTVFNDVARDRKEMLERRKKLENSLPPVPIPSLKRKD